MIWVLDHKRDLEADFRAFFHLDHRSMYRLDGPQFLSLATRTMAFSGVMAARVAKIQESKQRRGPAGNGERREHEGTTAVLTGHPVISKYVEYARG